MHGVSHKSFECYDRINMDGRRIDLNKGASGIDLSQVGLGDTVGCIQVPCFQKCSMMISTGLLKKAFLVVISLLK